MNKSSIKRKLRLIIMSLSGASILLVAVILMANNIISIRQTIVRDLSGLARIIGSNCTAALAFNDPKEAERTMEALKERPDLVAAVLYTNAGDVFATYVQNPYTSFQPPRLQPDSYLFDFQDNRFSLFAPVKRGNERMGTLFLLYSLNAVRESLRRYSLIVGSVLILSLLAAFGMSTLLQRFILRPIERLADAVHEVSDKKDYSLRVKHVSQDELGLLINGFNEMLEQIRLRDSSLRLIQGELEKRVQDRTRELQKEVADRRSAQEGLKQTVDELERSNKELERFAFVASHDLQEPLRKIISFGDRLKNQLGSSMDDISRDYLERTRKAATRMKELIEGLLEYSRVSAHERSFEPVNLGDVAREIASEMEIGSDPSKGRVEIGTLPTIKADRVQMRQLFQNLIGNAIKFRKKDVLPHVRIDSHSLNNSGVEISVEDNGIGFEEKYADRIFQPFQRLHNREQYEGAGMGLTICQKIVARHDGTISVNSAPGKGTRFLIRFPLK